MYSQFRDHSSTDIQNYYDAVPPAHRLSGYHNSSAAQSTQDIPLHSASSPTEPYFDIPGAAGAGAGAAAAATSLPRRTHFGDHRGEFVNYPSDSGWAEKSAPRGGRKKWFIIGGIAALIAIIIAVVLGVVLSKKKSSSSSDSVSGDPSNFAKDSRLKNSFYGIAYTPAGSLYPDCGNKLSEVVEDVQLLSQLTTRVRLYGSDCNQTALVLEAIKLTKVNLTVFIANYPEPSDNGTAYDRQKDAIKSAIQTYGTDHIGGVTVGNEFILNYLNANGGTSPNDAVGNAGANILTGYINDTKSMLSDLNVDLKVGNADAGAYFNDLVLEDVDYGMANVHPWFANVSIDQAAGWTWDFFQTNDVELADSLPNKADMSIAETGWPSESSDQGNESNGPSIASVGNLQKFLDTFVCQANQNGTEYYYFEFFDETWKDQMYGGVEGHWGLFYSNRTLKAITIPDCSS